MDIRVNDRPLIDVVRDAELPSATADDQPDLAGDYQSIGLEQLDSLPIQHFLGSPDSHLHCGPHEKTVLLICPCGETGCWPLMVRIEADERTVTWRAFEQVYRKDWDYGGLEFAFDRAQYEAALAELG